MYVDPHAIQRQKNFQRLREVAVLSVLVLFVILEYRAVRDLLVRMTHNLVATETNEIYYVRSGLGLWASPAVKYHWRGVDYERGVGGLFLANSAAIIPPVEILVDPEQPKTAILKIPYGGWQAWTIDFLVLQLALALFVYMVFIRGLRGREKSYFQ
jgi:hypothetical protein